MQTNPTIPRHVWTFDTREQFAIGTARAHVTYHGVWIRSHRPISRADAERTARAALSPRVRIVNGVPYLKHITTYWRTVTTTGEGRMSYACPEYTVYARSVTS